MPAKFSVYKDKKGEFRFRLLTAKVEIIATGESYPIKMAVLIWRLAHCNALYDMD